MGEEKSFDARLAVAELRCEQNEEAWKATLKEIRSLPAELKKMILEQFGYHQTFHNTIDKCSSAQAAEIAAIITRLRTIEELVIRIKANWKVIAGGFTAVVAGLVWVIQRGVEVVFFK